MLEIMIDLQGEEGIPLYEKIYGHIRDEIAVGRIPVGERLPSTRLLAEHLGVSRSTAETAYDQLIAEGYLRAEPRRGVFVCDISGLYQLRQPVNESAGAEEWETENVWELDFSPYAVDTKHFPYNIWRKISRNLLLDDREELLYAGHRQGEPAVRREIAAYLHQARGVRCRPSELILGAGNEYLELLLAQLLGREQTILMENPGYPQAYCTFSNMGYRVRTIPAGADGFTEEAIERLNPALIYIMPSHQFPMGTVMPLAQRLLLLRWAAGGEGRYLIEDDHDSEYRYRGKPVPSLQGMDRNGTVIYLGTFSKSIAPSLRVSYMVLPPRLMERYRQTCGFYSVTVARMQQEILGEFIRGGHFERHLNKMRGIYRSRHDFLLGALKKRGWAVRIGGEHAGLHVLVQAETALTEQEICRAAAERGMKISGLAEYRFGEEGEPAAESRIFGDAERKPAAGSVIPAGGKRKPAAGSVIPAGGKREPPVLLIGYGGTDEAGIEKGIRILDEIIGQGRDGQKGE